MSRKEECIVTFQCRACGGIETEWAGVAAYDAMSDAANGERITWNDDGNAFGFALTRVHCCDIGCCGIMEIIGAKDRT